MGHICFQVFEGMTFWLFLLLFSFFPRPLGGWKDAQLTDGLRCSAGHGRPARALTDGFLCRGICSALGSKGPKGNYVPRYPPQLLLFPFFFFLVGGGLFDLLDSYRSEGLSNDKLSSHDPSHIIMTESGLREPHASVPLY